MITGLHHAQITIPRGTEAQARAFYCQLLELPEIPKPESLQGRGGFWLQVGVQQVHVGTEDNVERQMTKAHLAYQVTDLAELQTRLQAEGYTIMTGSVIPGYVRFETRDPFGNRLECIQALNEPA